MTRVRPVAPQDWASLLALNNRHVPAVNALEPAALSRLLEVALLALAAGPVGAPTGLLILLGPAGPAEGPNHAWVREHHPEAAYIDRVVVSATARGQGLGRRFYAAAAGAAAQAGFAALGCEVNLDPPNPESLAFHHRLGFRPVGEATDPRNGKRVVYLLAPADPAPDGTLDGTFLARCGNAPCPVAPG